MRRALASAVAIAALHAPPARGDEGCNSRACVERVARKQCWRGNVRSCVHRAALHWGVSFSLMDTIVGCESGHDPSEVEPTTGAGGLMQFLASTWAENRYHAHDRLSAKWNALGGAWVIHFQGLSAWDASRHCWGSWTP